VDKIVVVILCHLDGHFSVWRGLGTGHARPIFKTRQEADARAKVLQDEAGGPEKASILVRDLTTILRRQARARAMRTPRPFGRV
jgi:hypothetical protein